MVKNFINFIIAVGFLLRQSLDLVVGLLHLLQSELHVTNISFIKSFIRELNSEDISETLELWQSVSSTNEDLILEQKA